MSAKAPRARAARTPRPTPNRERGQRRALSHVGGRVEQLRGSADLKAVIRQSLEIGDADPRPHIHGFHSYPAKLHPLTARHLIEGLSQPGAHVLDPFCGSGTVLIEARLAGRRATGIDLNPLAVELSRLKSHGLSARQRDALELAAARVVASATQRRREKRGPTQRYPAADLELFERHVLLELDGLRSAILKERSRPIRHALLLVFSSLLTKVSRRQSDSSELRIDKRLASGFSIDFFSKRSAELLQQLSAFARALPPRAPSPICHVADARRLGQVVDGAVDLVVTSPPYPGVFDYHHHHQARMRWLDLDAKALERREMGARRDLKRLSPEAAMATWEHDLTRVLAAIARRLTPEGKIALVCADTTLGGKPYSASAMLARVVSGAGLCATASGAQRRPHFHGPTRSAYQRQPRREHVFVLSKG